MPESPAVAELKYLRVNLRELRARLASTAKASLEAQDALERAQQVAADLANEERYLRTRCEELDRNIHGRHAALKRAMRERKMGRVQRLLGRFPVEMLQAIFVEATNYTGDIWCTRAKYDIWTFPDYPYDQAVVPFALAAVNRQWRAVALRTPTLWTLIAVPNLDMEENTADFVKYVDLMLERSRNLALDLILCWHNCHWDQSVHYGDILDAIGSRAHRWRSLSLPLPVDTPEQALGVLRRPMPQLEDVYLTRAAEGGTSLLFPWAEDAPAYIPFSPRIRCLHKTAFFHVPRLPLTGLRHLSFSVDDSVPINAIFQHVLLAPSLRELHVSCLSTPANDGTNPPLGPAVFPHLAVLGIAGNCLPLISGLTALDMPRLQEFRMINFEYFEEYSPLLDRIGETVTKLVCCDMGPTDSILASDMRFIRKLKQLRHLVFENCTHINSELPALLASRSAAGLPHLECISFEHPKMDEEQAGRVSALMLSLHALAATEKEGAVQFSLAADPDAVPVWLLQQYQFITGGISDAALQEQRPTVVGEADTSDIGSDTDELYG